LGVESPMDEHPVGEGFEASDAGQWNRDRHGFTWSPNRGVDSQGNGGPSRLSFLKEKEEVAIWVDSNANSLEWLL
jgi:hypothetical protein